MLIKYYYINYEYQHINNDPANFLRMLQEGGGGEETREGNLPPPQYVSVTQEEKEAIDRVKFES
jgi:hypothetical protein